MALVLFRVATKGLIAEEAEMDRIGVGAVDVDNDDSILIPVAANCTGLGCCPAKLQNEVGRLLLRRGTVFGSGSSLNNLFSTV